MASSPNRGDRFHDATDCRNLMEAGRVTFSATQFDPTLTSFGGVELGDDSGRWPDDGQCDDPRFIGEGMSPSPDHPEIEKDRSDCSYGFQVGELTLADELPPPLVSVIDGIDFGHDKGTYPTDNECDDPRFAGAGMATIALDPANIGGDRTDCLDAYQNGLVRSIEASVLDGVDFGDDIGLYANDGEIP